MALKIGLKAKQKTTDYEKNILTSSLVIAFGLKLQLFSITLFSANQFNRDMGNY
jgi:hypothetical protein